jgi:hypothetical protein
VPRYRIILDFAASQEGPAERLLADITALSRQGGSHPGVDDVRVVFQQEQRTWQTLDLPAAPVRRGTRAS